MKKNDSPINVLITVPFKTPLIQKLQQISPNLRITVHPAKNISEVPDELWARCEILYTNRTIPDQELAPNLRWVQHHYAGIDSFIHSLSKDRPNLIVTTLSGAATTQIAEYVLTMLLALGRQLPMLAELQKNANWPKNRWELLQARELRTSIVGIVGYGSIGRQIARLLREFGATVLATKDNAMQPADNGYTPENTGDPNGDFVHRLYPAQAIKSMVKECDFIVVAVPLAESTKNLIDSEVLSACQPTAYLIDVSRGGVVDHDALSKVLANGNLAGAVLDVFPEEPLPANSPLWKMQNVIITPHIAGFSTYYDERAVTLFAENLSRYIADLPLYNIFDMKKGY